MDEMAGGVGLRRGRTNVDQLNPGDALDFWRVSAVAPLRRLTLLAEMKMPGEALLDLQMAPMSAGRIELRMISRFRPRGLAGLTYWYALYPFHVWIFKGMLTTMARRLGMPRTPRPERFDPNSQNACALGGSGRPY